MISKPASKLLLFAPFITTDPLLARNCGPFTRQLYVLFGRPDVETVKEPEALVYCTGYSTWVPPDLSVRVMGNDWGGEGWLVRPCQVTCPTSKRPAGRVAVAVAVAMGVLVAIGVRVPTGVEVLEGVDELTGVLLLVGVLVAIGVTVLAGVGLLVAVFAPVGV